VEGKVSDKDEEIKLLADKVYAVNDKNLKEVLNPLKPNAIVRKKRFFSKKEKPNTAASTNNNNTVKKDFVNNKPANMKVENYNETIVNKDNNEGELRKLANPFKLIIKEELNGEELKTLKEIFAQYTGNSEVYIFEHFSNKIIKTPFKVNPSIILISEIKKEFPQKIRVVET